VRTPAAAQTRPPVDIPAFVWGLLGAVIALLAGLAASAGPMAGIGIVLLVSVGAATYLRPASILIILTASIYLEILAIGGITISRLLAPLALMVIVFQWLRGQATLRPALPVAWIVAYSTWALASLYWTASPSRTVELLASLCIALIYMASYAMLIDSEATLKQILAVFALAGMIVGAFSLLSFAGIGGAGGGEDLQAGRTQGGVGDPNFFANVQIVALPLTLALASAIKRRWLQLAVYGAALVMIASILSSLSRGGLIALVVVLLIVICMAPRSLLGSPRQKRVVIAVLMIGLMAFATRPTFRAEVIQRAESIFVTSQGSAASSNSGSGRTEIWKAARRAIDDHPIVGVGFGAFPAISRDYMNHTPGFDGEKFTPRAIETHSAPIGTFTELGLVGFVLFVGLIGATGVFLRRTARRAFRAGADFVGRVANACALSLVGWAISSLFIETQTSRPVWIVIGIALALPRMIPLAAQAAQAAGREPAEGAGVPRDREPGGAADAPRDRTWAGVLDAPRDRTWLGNGHLPHGRGA
jgi:O-antigen ligase